MDRGVQKRSDELGLVIFQEFSKGIRERISSQAGSAFEKVIETQMRTVAAAAWGGVATAVAGAINPIAGAVVGLIAGIVTAIFKAFEQEVHMLSYTNKFGYDAFMNWVYRVDYLVRSFLEASFGHLESNPSLTKEKVALAVNDLLRKMMIYKIDPTDRGSIEFWNKFCSPILLGLQQVHRNQEITDEQAKEITYKLYIGVLNQYLYRLYLVDQSASISSLYDIDPQKADPNKLRTIYYMTTSFILLQSLLDKKYLLLREILKFAFLHSLSRGYLISISDLDEHRDSKGKKYFEVYSLFVVDRFTLVLADRLAKFLQENPQLVKKKRLDIQLSSGVKVRVNIDQLLDALRLKEGGKYLINSFTDIEKFLNKEYSLPLVPSDYFLGFLTNRFFFSYNNWCYDRVNQFLHDLVHRIAVEVIDWDKLVDLCISDINKREILAFLLYGSFWSWINSIYHLWDWGNRKEDTPPFPIIYTWWQKRNKSRRKAIGNNLFIYEDTAVFENTKLKNELQIPFTFDVIECIDHVPLVNKEQINKLKKRTDCLLYPYMIMDSTCTYSDYYIISTWLGIGWSNFLLSLKYPIISLGARYNEIFAIGKLMDHYYSYGYKIYGDNLLKIYKNSKLNWFGEISKIGVGEYKVRHNKALAYNEHCSPRYFWHILDYTSSDSEYWFSVSSASRGYIGSWGEPINYLKDFIWLYPNVFLIGSYYDFYAYIFEAYGTESLGYKIRCYYNIATESLKSVLDNSTQAFNKWILALKETKAARNQIEAQQKTSISRTTPTALLKPVKPTAAVKPTKPTIKIILPLILIGSGIILLQKREN